MCPDIGPPPLQSFSMHQKIQLPLQESQEAPQSKKAPASGHNPFLTSLTDFGIRSKGEKL